ncbi:hypothetical protein FQN54_006613 [Arachnomyces sp. PD_36]|nr:hypothetical protein FQN54_006613 [Arachnomyces sp. PD_36]
MSESDRMSAEQKVDEQAPCPQPSPPKISRLALIYRKSAMWLLIFYIPLLIIPWVLTCALSGQPTDPQNTARKYLPQSGLMPNGALSLAIWAAVIPILGSIASVVTIPVTSALLAQAAVVYAQRRKNGQKLSMRQTFTLADQRWSDVTVIHDALCQGGSKRLTSNFLWLAMLLILLSAIQHPIQNSLVSWQSVPVVICLGGSGGACTGLTARSTIVAYDPEPAGMALLPQNSIV